MKYTKASTIQLYNKGENIDFLFFWGHQPRKDGSISKSCLSQWWISEFFYDGIVYNSSEHYMMAEKARLFGDEEIRNQIILSKSPKEAKHLGRKVRGFDRKLWDENKCDIVINANQLKFSQNETLKAFLEQSKGQIIVEASPFDSIWGIGMAENNPDVHNPNLWNGENLLGFVLMEVRDTL